MKENFVKHAKMIQGNKFIKNLYKILQEARFGNIINWGIDGKYFQINDIEEFSQIVLL